MNSYIIITPVKDEEKYIELTIQSVIKQTIRPLQWIIVDDGSVDKTREIVEKYTKQYDWIKSVSSDSSGPRQPGIRHLKAFYKGYDNLDRKAWDFIVKLDGDLSFDECYFERCFAYFRENPRLGIGGGVILNVIKDKLVPEKHPLFHVRGATKIYSRQCWDAIGGLIVAQCYDTLDEVKANMLGYETRSFTDLKLIHHRYTGKAYGRWGSSVKNGMANYLSGYHPLFMIVKCGKRFVLRPHSIDAFGLGYGFIKGYVKNIPRAVDSETMRYLRRQQLRRLIFLPSIWK